MLLLAVMAVLIVEQLVSGSSTVIKKEGFGFFTSSDWNVESDLYGALPFAWGTCMSALIAILLGGTVGVLVSVFLVALAPRKLLRPFGILVDLLAAIPSIIYGLWGIFVLIPWLRNGLYPELQAMFGWTGLFGTDNSPVPGTGLFTAGLVLGIMIIPTVAAVTREVLLTVPSSMRDGALALGVNRTEALRSVEIPYATSGILGGLILGLGRALGETMAVTMVIGNSPALRHDLLKPAASLASAIAAQFGEASGTQRSALIGLGLVLFVITVIMNGAARLMVYRVQRKNGASA